MNWRDMVAQNPDISVEMMAANRIMKGMGSSSKQIGDLCRRFGIEYIEEETSFTRAVKILREVYPLVTMVSFIDARSGKSATSIYDDLLNDDRTGIVFYRVDKSPELLGFVKGPGLMMSPLGQIVIKPGIRYMACRDGVELWEQDPVRLIKSFSTNKEE